MLVFPLSLASAPRAASAQARAAKGATADPPNVAAAKKHAERAHDLYAQGSYREAIAELEQALKLDPTGKELVYNIAVVHEKLGDVDDALKYFRQYAAMDLTAEEREKTEGAIHRLEGAKREIEAKQEAERQRKLEEERQNAEHATPPGPTVVSVQRGRLDGWTIGFGVATFVALVPAIIAGRQALVDKPSSGFVTGQDGSFADLQNRATTAHRDAILSDAFFGVSAACAITASILYFSRPRTYIITPKTGASTTVSAAPTRGGGAFVVSGDF